MKKTVLTRPTTRVTFPDTHLWLDLATVADVEISSEDPEHPFENCLSLQGAGWRAATPGPQVLRLLFSKPLAIRNIHLEFTESAVERTQEFSVTAHFSEESSKEVVRQQWSFSPSDSSSEVEDYVVNLQDVSAIEIHIDPGRHDKQCIASLEFIALA